MDVIAGKAVPEERVMRYYENPTNREVAICVAWTDSHTLWDEWPERLPLPGTRLDKEIRLPPQSVAVVFGVRNPPVLVLPIDLFRHYFRILPRASPFGVATS